MTYEEFKGGAKFKLPKSSTTYNFETSSDTDGYIKNDDGYYCNIDTLTKTSAQVYQFFFDKLIKHRLYFKDLIKVVDKTPVPDSPPREGFGEAIPL